MMEMYLAGIGVDPRNGQPIIFLADAEKRRALPIWTGLEECQAIANALNEAKPERPSTHDLLLNSIRLMGFQVDHIYIYEITNNTYYSKIVLRPTVKLADQAVDMKEIDCRPSDGIALAMRTDAPVFISPQVVAEGTVPADAKRDELEADQFKEFVSELKASDFDKLNRAS